MKLELRESPRTFQVGEGGAIEIHDLGDIQLAPNEQITFVTESGARYDFARKDWGFYATPSINGRLASEGFKTALVKNQQGRIYVMVVEETMLAAFELYCENEQQTLLHWLDEETPNA